MDHDDADQLFELALDLPERDRERLLQQVAADRPELAAMLRSWLEDPTANRHFALQTAAPRPAGPDRVAHVAVPVADVGRAAAWYLETFSCTVESQQSYRAVLAFANVRLLLVAAGTRPPHVAIARADAERFGRTTPNADGSRSLFVVDPWGNAIEVVEDRAPTR